MKLAVFVWLVILVCLAILSTGCKIPRGNIVSVTTSVIGLRVGLNPATESPELQIGFFRSTFQIVPTSTNEIHTPIVNSSLALDRGNLGGTEIFEDFETGNPHSTVTGTNSTAKIRAAMKPQTITIK